jgi:hypothetical protein
MAASITATHLAEMPVRWGGLIVTFGYDVVGSRIEVTEITMRREDGGPILATARPPIARLAEIALSELRTHWAPQIVAQRPSETAVMAARILLDAPGPRRGRPPTYGPEHWREVDAIYRRGGTVAVAAFYSLSYSTAWKWSHRQAAQLGASTG